MQNLAFKGFEGPGDLHAVFNYRPGTADENTILATYKEDEYKFATLPPAPGDWMIDAGGYVGSTAILYAQLYPACRVLCIEPLPENVEIIRKNIDSNHLFDRIVLLERALWSTSVGEVKIYYRDASMVGKVHRFVGSAVKQYHETVSDEYAKVPTISLMDCMRSMNMERVRVLKMDIEGSEYVAVRTLTEDYQKKIETIVGEYHNIFPGVIGDPRTQLYQPLKNVFDDKSPGPEVKTWGAFLFVRKA